MMLWEERERESERERDRFCSNDIENRMKKWSGEGRDHKLRARESREKMWRKKSRQSHAFADNENWRTTEGPPRRGEFVIARAIPRKIRGKFRFTCYDFIPFRFKANEMFNAMEHFTMESTIPPRSATMLRASNIGSLPENFASHLARRVRLINAAIAR